MKALLVCIIAFVALASAQTGIYKYQGCGTLNSAQVFQNICPTNGLNAYLQPAIGSASYNVTVQTNWMTVVITAGSSVTTLVGPFNPLATTPGANYVSGVVGTGSDVVTCPVVYIPGQGASAALTGNGLNFLCQVPGSTGTQAIATRLWTPTAPSSEFQGTYSPTCTCTGAQVCNPIFAQTSYNAQLAGNLLTLHAAGNPAVTITGHTNAVTVAGTTNGVFVDGTILHPVNTTLSPVDLIIPSNVGGSLTAVNGTYSISLQSFNALGTNVCTLSLVKSAAAALQMSVFVIAAVATTIFATVF